jgi:hypothetical protein
MAEEIPCNEHEFSLSLLLPPLGAVILKPLPPETGGAFEVMPTSEKTEDKQRGERRRKKRKKKKRGKHR